MKLFLAGINIMHSCFVSFALSRNVMTKHTSWGPNCYLQNLMLHEILLASTVLTNTQKEHSVCGLKYDVCCSDANTDRWTRTFGAGRSNCNSCSARFDRFHVPSQKRLKISGNKMFQFPYQLSLSRRSRCAYHRVTQDAALWAQCRKLQFSKTLGPPSLIVMTVLILQATGILWSSCCTWSELSFSTPCL